MSKPIRCSVCGDMVGVRYNLGSGGSRAKVKECPGYGNHPKPVRSECRRFFVKVWILVYPNGSYTLSSKPDIPGTAAVACIEREITYTVGEGL